MITRIVKVKVLPEHHEVFVNYMSTFLTQAKEFKNNHHADCFVDLDEEFHYHIYTIWKTEGALNKFRKSEISIEFKNNLSGWCKSPYSAWTVENIFN
ncbi:MAG: antibiotic biosynthesis monooxygenase [Salinivirgaceae bacterium]|nr:antibiotic biosynthesis monooxygenase [Salinivirgaceae bacterium]